MSTGRIGALAGLMDLAQVVVAVASVRVAMAAVVAVAAPEPAAA